MDNKEKINKIKELIEELYPKYVCGCFLIGEISRIVNANIKKR